MDMEKLSWESEKGREEKQEAKKGEGGTQVKPEFSSLMPRQQFLRHQQVETHRVIHTLHCMCCVSGHTDSHIRVHDSPMCLF